MRIRAGCITLCVLSLLVVAGCGGAPKQPPPGGVQAGIERFTVDGQAAVLFAPFKKTTKVVIYTHGAGETIEKAFRDTAKRQIFKVLVDAGYALAADDAHGDNWGNPASRRDSRALVAEVMRRGYRDIYVLALSMGGFNGLQLLDDVPVKAWAGIFPACDLASVYAGTLFPGEIRSAYGVSDTQSMRDVLATRSPIPIDPPAGLPMRFWASPDDHIIPKRENTDACAQIARRRGARVEVTTTRGEHGDASNYDPAGVLQLFDSAGG